MSTASPLSTWNQTRFAAGTSIATAAPGASLILPFVKLGLTPEAGSSLLLPAQVGHRVAAEMVLLGRPVGAERALALGLINQIDPDPLGAARALAQEIAAQPPAAVRAAKRLLRAQAETVRDRIDRDYAHPLDVEALARGIAMSAGHLSREFKRAYGESPYSYLMTRRIERALTLLRRGDLSVTDICFAVGCSSLGTFSTRFTELVGMSPTEYRRRAADETLGIPTCLATQITRPIRNREVSPAGRR